MIIDTHIHLYDDRYKDELNKIIEDAKLADVKKMLIVGYDYESSLEAVKLANDYEGFYAAVGIHPSEVGKPGNEDLGWIEDLLKEPKVIAIGEIGLDYYWDKSYKDLQKEVFIKQIEIANKHNLPISIHSRSASNDTFEILRDNPVRGVLHCYSQSLELGREYVKLGYYLGIGGVLTFKNSKEIKDVVSEIDLKHMVVETDGPYLAPHPFRGKLNRPEYLSLVVEEIAKIKNMSVNDVKEILEKNTFDLFGI